MPKMLAIDLKCQPRQRQNGKWMFTIFGNNRWEESGSEFSTPEEEAVRTGAVPKARLDADLETARRTGDMPSMQRALTGLTSLRRAMYGAART
jgi:hypothetical protein